MTNGHGLVSIVILTHDNWPDLELAVESALAQSWPAKEIIIIDNDSLDETQSEVEKRYAGRLKYIRQSNTQDSGGYNRGIRESRGEFVQLLDGDDFLAPNKVARQMAVFAADPAADIVYGETRQFQAGSGTPEWSDWETTSQPDMLAALIDPAAAGAGLVIHTALFRRRVFEKVGEWDQTLIGADMDFWLRSAWAGCKFVFSPGAWCFHRRRAGQMSSNTRTMVQRTVRTLEKALSYVDRDPYRMMINQRLASLRLGIALTDMELDRSSALHELRLARKHDSHRVGPFSYALAQALIRMPGARRLIKHPLMASLRQPAARALRVTG